MKKKNFVFGAIILIISGLISKFLGAVYKIPLINIMGTEGLGIFQLVFPIYSLFLVLASSGITISLSKLISQENANGNGKNIKIIFKSSVFLMSVLGLFFCGLLFLLAPLISKVQATSTALCYYAISPAILFTCLIIVFRGYFQGLQNMVPSAIVQVVEQITKLVGSLILVKLLIPYGIIYGVFGALLGVSLSELISLFTILLIFLFNRKKIKMNDNNPKTLNFKTATKKLVFESLPIMLNAIIFPLSSAFDSLIIVFLLNKAGIVNSTALSLFGLNSGVVGSVTSAPSIIAVAISTSLLPSISSSFKKGELAECKQKSKMAIKLSWVLCLPFVVIMILLSGEITSFLYSNGLKTVGINEIKIASDLLKLSAVSVVYVSFLDITTSILQAVDKSYIPVKNLIISIILRFIIMFVLVTTPTINIYGVVIADISCLAIAVILNLKKAKRYLDLSFDYLKFAIVPLISAGGMVIIIKVFQFAFTGVVTSRLLTALVMFVGMIAYLILIFGLKVFSKEEMGMFNKLRKKTEK